MREYDIYHDNMGNRSRLDTRMLEKVAGTTAQPIINRREQEEQENRARRINGLLRLAISVPCTYFAISHIEIVYRHPIECLEAVGVIACLAFLADSIRSLWREEE